MNESYPLRDLLRVTAASFSAVYHNGHAALWTNGFWVSRSANSVVSQNYTAGGQCYAEPFISFRDEKVTTRGVGKVFIYSGNTSLTHTTAANDDELAPIITNSISIYPNPISKHEPFVNLKLNGSKISRHESITVEIFNLKGQMINTWDMAADDASRGVYQIDCQGIAAGIYFILAKQGKQRLGSTKLLVY